MEAEMNSFVRRSKRYRTKYFDELGKLYKESRNDDNNPREGVKFDQGKTISEKR